MTKISYFMDKFDPKNVPEQDWDKIIEYYYEAMKEQSPEDPKAPEEIIKKNFTTDNPTSETSRWYLYKDDTKSELIGSIFISVEKPNSPNYEANKNIAFSLILIRKQFRNFGLGSELIKFLAERAKDMNIQKLQWYASTESAINFSNKIKAEKALINVENRLALSDVDWNMMRTWIKEGEEKNPETVLEIHGFYPRDELDEYVDLLNEIGEMVPLGDLENEITLSPEVILEQDKQMTEFYGEKITVVTKEKNNKISAITDVGYYKKRNPKRIIVFTTGVRKSDQGRGLAKWIKAKMLFIVSEKFPEVTYFTTGNADYNKPMLHINKKIGFKPSRQGINYQIEVKDILKL